MVVEFPTASGHERDTITLEQYKDFWAAGLSIYEPEEFHPFFCEIYSVEECPDQAVPKLLGERWPCLMFGELLFSRASVKTAANPNSIHKKTAEESTLYWCHKRKDRKYDDLSHGWGSNSQWSTEFPFDYWSGHDLLYNVNHGTDSFEDKNMPQEEQLELLRYRCYVKTLEKPDCFPYHYFFAEKYKKKESI